MSSMQVKAKEFLIKYEPKIILVLGFVLVAGLSFEAGIIKGRDYQEKPLVIEKPVSVQPEASKDNNIPGDQNIAPESSKNFETGNLLPQNCAFIGSKNSNKYHLSNCRWAKQIKPENQTCFSSEDEAKSKGYLPDKNCIR